VVTPNDLQFLTGFEPAEQTREMMLHFADGNRFHDAQCDAREDEVNTPP